MSRTQPHHKMVDETGVGRCSVPMWSMGCDAGFCDAPAYGRPVGKPGRWEDGRFIPAYIPGLACPRHGGPDRPVVHLAGAWSTLAGHADPAASVCGQPGPVAYAEDLATCPTCRAEIDGLRQKAAGVTFPEVGSPLLRQVNPGRGQR